MNNRTSSLIITGLILTLLVLPACSTPSPTPIPDPIEYSTFKEYTDDCANVLAQNRPVMVTGELRLGSETTCDRFGCNLELWGRTPEGFLDRLMIYVHDSMQPEANEMAYLGDDYTDEDLKLYTETGRVLGVGDLVTVIGWPPGQPCWSIDVVIIR